MTLPTGPERDVDHAKQLLEEYCFDLRGFQAGELVSLWQERLETDPSWIRAAVIEALYQGRYKAFSVEQILQSWKRRGHPIRHFNSEFERIILGPIDPTASKYASMTTASPSELMLADTTPTQPPRTVTLPESPATAQEPANLSSSEAGNRSVAENTAASPTSPSDVVDANIPSAVNDPAERKSSNVSESPHPHMSIADTSAFNQPEPIRKFVPDTETSQFYQRLQSVVRQAP